jgi:ribosomal protein S18 acetylase RimI-like enzyme
MLEFTDYKEQQRTPSTGELAMQLKSLGFQTELLFRRFEGEVIERPYYLVIRTPKNPGYRWGNFLIFQDPPKEGDLEKWKDIFAKEIGTPPDYNHFVFGIDGLKGEAGVLEPFLKAGFELEKTVVMTARTVNPPPKFNKDCTIRTFQADDWQEWIQLNLDSNNADTPEKRDPDDEGFYRYLERKASEYQRMIEAGSGQWFGAYLDGQLAASLGLFVWNGLGRFQAVDTHPNFRRRGLAGTLVYHAARQGFSDMGAETLVMCADPDYVAVKIYESVGFKITEQQMALQWYPKDI